MLVLLGRSSNVDPSPPFSLLILQLFRIRRQHNPAPAPDEPTATANRNAHPMGAGAGEVVCRVVRRGNLLGEGFDGLQMLSCIAKGKERIEEKGWKGRGNRGKTQTKAKKRFQFHSIVPHGSRPG